MREGRGGVTHYCTDKEGDRGDKTVPLFGLLFRKKRNTVKKNTVKLPVKSCAVTETLWRRRLELQGEKKKKKRRLKFSWHLINRRSLAESDRVQLGDRWDPINESRRAAATTVTSVRDLGSASVSWSTMRSVGANCEII